MSNNDPNNIQSNEGHVAHLFAHMRPGALSRHDMFRDVEGLGEQLTAEMVQRLRQAAQSNTGAAGRDNAFYSPDFNDAYWKGQAADPDYSYFLDVQLHENGHGLLPPVVPSPENTDLLRRILDVMPLTSEGLADEIRQHGLTLAVEDDGNGTADRANDTDDEDNDPTRIESNEGHIGHVFESDNQGDC